MWGTLHALMKEKDNFYEGIIWRQQGIIKAQDQVINEKNSEILRLKTLIFKIQSEKKQ